MTRNKGETHLCKKKKERGGQEGEKGVRRKKNDDNLEGQNSYWVKALEDKPDVLS